MKKLLAILLTLSMLLAFAACTPDEDTTKTDDPKTNTAQEEGDTTTEEVTEGDTTQEGDTQNNTATTTEPQTNAKGDPVTTEKGTDAQKDDNKPTTTAEILECYKNATQLFKSKKPGTKKVVKNSIGTMTSSDQAKLDNLLGIELFSVKVRVAVGNFLGEGDNDYSAKKGENDDNVLVSKLKVSDVKGTPTCVVSGKNYVLTIPIINETNPKKDGASAMGRFTQDFKTEEEVHAALKKDTKNIVKIENIVYKTSKVQIKATINIETGRLVEVVHSYTYTVDLGKISYGFGAVPDAHGVGTCVSTVKDFVW